MNRSFTSRGFGLRDDGPLTLFFFDLCFLLTRSALGKRGCLRSPPPHRPGTLTTDGSLCAGRRQSHFVLDVVTLPTDSL